MKLGTIDRQIIVTDRLSDNFSLVKASHKHRMSEVGDSAVVLIVGGSGAFAPAIASL
jgi:hypothetical protein